MGVARRCAAGCMGSAQQHADQAATPTPRSHLTSPCITQQLHMHARDQPLLPEVPQSVLVSLHRGHECCIHGSPLLGAPTATNLWNPQTPSAAYASGTPALVITLEYLTPPCVLAYALNYQWPIQAHHSLTGSRSCAPQLRYLQHPRTSAPFSPCLAEHPVLRCMAYLP